MSDWGDVALLGGVAIVGFLVYQKITSDSHDKQEQNAPVGNGGNLVVQPDQVMPDGHPFHDTILDPVYDSGWNFMYWLRQSTGLFTDASQGLVW